jgi:ferredoxin
MRLQLDTEACMGHGRCYSLAPQLFDADDEGHSVLLEPEVPVGQERGARDAQESCPEEAITLTE